MRGFLHEGRRWPLAVALVALLSFVGCGGGGGGGGGGGLLTGAFSEVIGPAGGTITADSGPLDGTILTIPAGAVATDTTFTMSPGTDITTQIGDFLVGPSIEIEPSGTTFAAGPVTLEIPYDNQGFPSGQDLARMEVLHRDAAGTVTRLPVAEFPVGEETVVVDVPSLSTFQPSLPPFDLSGLWLHAVVDGAVTLSPPPTTDELDTGRVDLIQDRETGEVTLSPMDATDANDDPIIFTGSFLGNRVSLSSTYAGDDGQVTEDIELHFLSGELGYGTITETPLGEQPTVVPITVFRASNLAEPTYSTSSDTVWDLEIQGGEGSDATLPSSDLADVTTTARLVQLAPGSDPLTAGVALFLTDDQADPFVGTVTGDSYTLARRMEVGGGTLVEYLSFTRTSDVELESGVPPSQGFAFYWTEGTIDNPPAEDSVGNFGSGSATLTDE